MNWKFNRMRRFKRVKRKDNSVSLVAKNKEEEASKVVVSEAPSRNVGERKHEAENDKGKTEIEDELVHQEDLYDIDEYLSFMSRKFSKLMFKRNPAMLKSIPHF